MSIGYLHPDERTCGAVVEALGAEAFCRLVPEHGLACHVGIHRDGAVERLATWPVAPSVSRVLVSPDEPTRVEPCPMQAWVAWTHGDAGPSVIAIFPVDPASPDTARADAWERGAGLYGRATLVEYGEEFAP